MRIPMGNFGFATAQPDLQRAKPPVGAFVQDGIGAISGALSNIANDAMAEQRRKDLQAEAEAKAAQKEADRVKAITAQAQAKNQLADLHDQLAQGLADGSVDKTKIGQVWADKSSKIVEGAIGMVPAEHQDTVRALLLDGTGRAQRNITALVTQQNKQDVAGGIGAYTEQMQRYAMRGDAQRAEAIANVADFMRTAGPQAGLRTDQIEKGIQGFKEGVTFSYLDNQVSQSGGSNKALKGILKDLSGDKYAELDPNKRNFLEAKIQRNMDHNDRVAEVAYNRRMSELDRYAKRLSWYVENGQDIPANELSQFDTASRGTPYAGMVTDIIKEQKQLADFSRLPPNQQVAKYNELRQSYGDTPNKEQLTHLAKVGRFVDNSIKLLRESPLDYSVQREGAKIDPLDMNSPQSWSSNLQARVAVLTEQSNRTGVPPKGLFPQEAQVLGSMLKQATAPQKTQILTALRQGFQDEKIYRATLQQIAPDDPVTAIAGVMASRGLKSTRGRTVADLILQGQDVLNPNRTQDGKPIGGKLLPMPKDTDMLRSFSNYEKDAFAGTPEVRNGFYQTAKAIYAAKSVEDGDYSGEINAKRWDAAMNMATGGIQKYNGRAVVLPYGLDSGDFKDKVSARLDLLAKSGAIDASFTKGKLADLPLENVGDGRYVMRAGDGVLVDKTGKPVVIDLNEQQK